MIPLAVQSVLACSWEKAAAWNAKPVAGVAFGGVWASGCHFICCMHIVDSSGCFNSTKKNVCGMQAPNMRLTHAEKEDTLKQLLAEGWIARTPDRPGCYSVGVRTFLELGQYLTELDLPESTRNIWQKFL